VVGGITAQYRAACLFRVEPKVHQQYYVFMDV